MSENPSTGGSAAAQAYRAEMERQGASAESEQTPPQQQPQPQPPQPASAGPAKNGRAVERKRMSGRARVARPGLPPLIGKMYDLSETGACILLDSMLPNKAPCVLEIEIFHDGKRHVFSTQAQAVYGIFSSGKGFKVGFQFGPRSPEASKSIAALVA
jgi:hypothetical protein